MFFAIALSELPGKRYKKFVQTVTTVPNFVSWVLVYAFATALLATENGIDMVIMNGKNPDLLYDLFDNKQVGTLFLAKNGKGVTA